MVILYTNENNPAALKLIIAKNIAKQTVDVKVVNVNDEIIPEPKHLPCLELENQLFSPNGAICYFVPTTDNNFNEIANLLEWEATSLSPHLANLLGGTNKNETLKSSVETDLKFLNEFIENKTFLVESSISAADIAIWSTLYPLNSYGKQYLSSFTNVSRWIATLSDFPEFKEAITSFKMDVSASYNALLKGAKYLTISEEKAVINQEIEPAAEKVTPEELEAVRLSWNKNISQFPKLKTTEGPVLPVAGEKNVFVTSALPYVNNVPHLGNIIGCVLSADVFARYSRICNNNTIYISGTDEYGTATETKALEEGLTCREICDKYYKIHKEIYDWFNIKFDKFGRSSDPQQTQVCQDMFLTLRDNGYMFVESIEQLHCEKCKKFLADRFVEGGCPNVGCDYPDARGDQCDGCSKLVNSVELKNPRCKICGNTPVIKSSKQFFIDLPKLEAVIYSWLNSRSDGWSNNAQVIAKSWLKEGLKPRCITRDLKWGVPVPVEEYKDKVFYVWFDAVIGYLSISKSYTEQYEKWWRPERGTQIKLYQFMAKDNVPFHAVLFPSMLLGCNKNYITVDHLMATEYLNYEDGKFSKSRGVGVFGTDARDTGIPSDVWRFYLLYVRPESQDSSFSWNDLVTKNNSELLNNLGNFVNRALVFAKNNFDAKIPEMNLLEQDFNLLALCTREYKGYVESLEKAKFRDGIRHILSISRLGNQYMQSNKPWALLKGKEDEKLRAGTVIGVCCNLACLLATLLHPYMPDTSENLKKQLNCDTVVLQPDAPEIVTMLPSGHKLGEPTVLFAKIEHAKAEELKKKFAGKQQLSETTANSKNVQVIQEEITKQGDKVRQLKSSGAAKTVWEPEVKILLDLKKRLEQEMQKGVAPAPQPVRNRTADPKEAERLEDEVAKQGAIVRKLKESGAEKSVWQPEVNKLLSLKKDLAESTGAPSAPTQKGKKSKK